MFRFAFLLAVTFFGFATLPAAAASFDCAKAATPFEKAICDSPILSAADDRLDKTYQTAIGGLSEEALALVRGDQRSWLDFARRACAPEAKPMTSGTYNETRTQCLIGLFDNRSDALEMSRMINGLRFYPRGEFAALPDPDAEGPDATWGVAQHVVSYVQLDSTAPSAKTFNDYVAEQAVAISGEDAAEDGSSDTSNSIAVKAASETRVTLDVTTYWYGHGAAHGDWSVSYLHYLVDEGRALVAGDIFAGKRWKGALLDLAVEALKAEHGDELMLEDNQYIADSVADPTRWDLSDPYGMIIQFQPYEVSYYAYGAPTARIPWVKLQPYLSETADAYRY